MLYETFASENREHQVFQKKYLLINNSFTFPLLNMKPDNSNGSASATLSSVMFQPELLQVIYLHGLKINHGMDKSTFTTVKPHCFFIHHTTVSHSC